MSDLNEPERHDLEPSTLSEVVGDIGTLIDGVPVLIWISDWTKAGIYFNRAWLDFTGRTLEEEKGDGWVENVHPDDLVALELCRRAFIERRPFITDFRLRRHDGEYRWMLDAGQPRFTADGSFLGYIGSCIDITERRTVEAALRRSEEMLRMALETARLGVWEHELRTGALETNRICKAHLGLPADAPLTPAMLLDCYHPEDRGRVDAAIGSVIAGQGDCDIEARVRGPDGTVRWLVTRAHSVLGEDGAPARVVGITLDTTERKHTEEQLRENEERLREAQDIAQLGRWEFDLVTQKITWSDEVFRIFGRDPRLGEPSFEELGALLHPDDRLRLNTLVQRAVKHGKGFEAEWRARRPDGSYRWKRTRARVFRDASGKVARLVGIDIDITDRKAAEERQKLLMAELDHRVRNTLAAIRSIVALAARGPQSKEEFALAVQGRIGAFARAHGLLTEARWRGASLRQVAATALDPYGVAAPRWNISGEDITVLPRAAVSISLVFHELATNAAKYGALSVPEGTVAVAWRLLPRGRILGLVWREAGGPPVSAPAGHGFGSTLIEQLLVSELGGSARFDYRPEGFRMRARLPLASLSRAVGPEGPAEPAVEDEIMDEGWDEAWDETGSEAGSEVGSENGAVGDAQLSAGVVGRRVLVVEDDLLIGLDIAASLREGGADVLGPVPDYQDAMKMIAGAADGIDAAVLDVNLRGEHTFPLAAQLEASGTPFLFISGYDAGTFFPHAYRNRPALQKPVTGEALVAAVSRLFEAG